MRDRRACDPHMHLAGAGLAHHAHDFDRSGAAHERIVDQDDTLALYHRAVSGMLEPDAQLADLLRRLDEGAADIVVADDAGLVGRAGFLPVADGGGYARVGHGDDDVGLGVRLARELRAQILAHLVDAAPADDRIRPREIDVFEDARARRYSRERLHRLDAF